MKIRNVIFMSLLFATGIVACTGPDQEEVAGGEFAIYLTAENLTIDDDVDLAQIELAEIPVLTSADINWYASETHVIKFEASVAVLLDALELPGRRFVVTVEQEPIYAGTFMAGFFSRSDDGVVILWPPMDGEENTITIQLGYPGADFFSGVDPRSDPRILNALRQAGKLR